MNKERIDKEIIRLTNEFKALSYDYKSLLKTFSDEVSEGDINPNVFNIVSRYFNELYSIDKEIKALNKLKEADE